MTSHFKIDQRGRDTVLQDDAIGAFLDLERHKVITPRHLYPSGIQLFKQGFSLEGVYWIETGLVKLVHLDGEGRESIVGLRSGESRSTTS
jgi:CRP-like cAMP-binding protein